MSQLTLFPQPTSGEIYWNAAEDSGSALRQFYSATDGEQRMSAYHSFSKSCQVFAEQSGCSFVEASQKIHNMFNIKTGKH